MNALEGRVALVTGSSRGIGEAIAAELARQGAAVAVHGRDQAAAGNVAARIRQHGGTAAAVTGDVTRPDQLEAIRRQIEGSLGPVDILVANAGGSFTPPAPLEDIPEAEWHATIDGNLTATFLLGLQVDPPLAHFTPVTLANQVTLDYDQGQDIIQSCHYAFLASDEEFDAAFTRIQDAGIGYFADPACRETGQTYHRASDGCRGVYFRDPDGHLMEILTRPAR